MVQLLLYFFYLFFSSFSGHGCSSLILAKENMCRCLDLSIITKIVAWLVHLKLAWSARYLFNQLQQNILYKKNSRLRILFPICSLRLVLLWPLIGIASWNSKFKAIISFIHFSILRTYIAQITAPQSPTFTKHSPNIESNAQSVHVDESFLKSAIKVPWCVNTWCLPGTKRRQKSCVLQQVSNGAPKSQPKSLKCRNIIFCYTNVFLEEDEEKTIICI